MTVHSIESPRRPGRPCNEETRAAILAAAYRLVTEEGYPNVTTQRIAEEAGSGKQTLYRWWDSKALVVLDALAEHGRKGSTRSSSGPSRRGIWSRSCARRFER
jgi:AcrR family transcriptional regulator